MAPPPYSSLDSRTARAASAAAPREPPFSKMLRAIPWPGWRLAEDVHRWHCRERARQIPMAATSRSSMTVGKRIRVLREARNMSQEDVARGLHVGVDLVSKWECDEHMPDVPNVWALMRLFGCAADDVIGRGASTPTPCLEPERSASQHAAVLAVLLRERPTCLDCTAAALGVSVSHINQCLAVIGAALQLVRVDDQHCRRCGETRPVFSIRPWPNLVTETYETYVPWRRTRQ